jgi:hypothetical protein
MTSKKRIYGIEDVINAMSIGQTPSLITSAEDIQAIRKGILKGLKHLMDDQDDERPIECKVDEAVVVELNSRWAQANGMWK